MDDRSQRWQGKVQRCGTVILSTLAVAVGGAAGVRAQGLPDAPSAVLLASTGDKPQAGATGESKTQSSSAQTGHTAAPDQAKPAALPPCPKKSFFGGFLYIPGNYNDPCEQQNPLEFIVDPGPVKPLTTEQKGMLAVRGELDPFGLITLVGFSGISIASNAHSPYGPGFRGWGRLIGYGLVETSTGNFFGTFAIPSLVHEDPRYHRLPGKPFGRRLGHAIIHTYVSQHDDGSLMPNYATLLDYPIGNELASLYVPGATTNAKGKFDNTVLGIATDPVGAIIAEFLPDVAKRIHVHIIFVQQIINKVANGPNNNGTGI
jgi:hypothetical protein